MKDQRQATGRPAHADLQAPAVWQPDMLSSVHAAILASRWPGARQLVVQGRSLSGLRMAQMWLIRSAAMSNANTVTVVPSC